MWNPANWHIHRYLICWLHANKNDRKIFNSRVHSIQSTWDAHIVIGFLIGTHKYLMCGDVWHFGARIVQFYWCCFWITVTNLNATVVTMCYLWFDIHRAYKFIRSSFNARHFDYIEFSFICSHFTLFAQQTMLLLPACHASHSFRWEWMLEIAIFCAASKLRSFSHRFVGQLNTIEHTRCH